MSMSTIDNRIAADPVLGQYRDLLEYDWSNADDHLAWVATAPVTEIVAWAETIRRDERANDAR